jgi:hypothetical protein
MKNTIYAAILLMPILVSAQNIPGVDPQKMQAMMQKAQEMQACMQKVDQTEMKAFQQRVKQTGEEVKALCSAGKRAEALSKAMSFSKEIASSTTMQEMKKCGEIMKGFMPDFSEITRAYQDDGSKGHICDQ